MKANYQQGCFDLEKIQLEDGRIGNKVASHDSIYFERGWELFSALRIFHGFYIIWNRHLLIGFDIRKSSYVFMFELFGSTKRKIIIIQRSIGCINSVVIQFLIYIASHMPVADILRPSFPSTFMYLCRTVIHTYNKSSIKMCLLFLYILIFHENFFLRYWPRSTLICVNVDFRWHWILVGVDTGLLIYFTICFFILLVLAAEIEMPSICKLSITQLQLSVM